MFLNSSVGKESAWDSGDTGGVVSVPGWGRSPGERNATHSRVRAWRIPWTEEPVRLQSMGHKESDTTDPVSKWSKCYWHNFLTVQGWDKIGKGKLVADINLGKTPFSLILFHIRQKDEQCSMSYMRVLKAVSPKSFHHTGKIVLFL